MEVKIEVLSLDDIIGEFVPCRKDSPFEYDNFGCGGVVNGVMREWFRDCFFIEEWYVLSVDDLIVLFIQLDACDYGFVEPVGVFILYSS